MLSEHGKTANCPPDDAEARFAISQLVCAKPEPSIPEPGPGEGWGLCTREAATEYRCAHWPPESPWKPVDKWWNPSPLLAYYYRRPIAKPEPQWVACTAEEAQEAVKSARVEWHAKTSDEWRPLEEDDSVHVHAAYRTTATLPEWVAVSGDTFAFICARDDSHTIEKSMSKQSGFTVRRSTIPLGTVLG